MIVPGAASTAADIGRPVLSLSALDAYDPRPAGAGPERRYCCPLPACQDKPVDRAHQALCVNTESGLWLCNRCGVSGKLSDRWEARPLREVRRAAALRSIRVVPDRQPGAAETASQLPGLLGRCRPVAGTPGEGYLDRRGIDVATGTAAGVLYTGDCYGRPGVAFPLRARAGEIVAVNIRHTDGRTDPKTRSVGDRSLGVFATPRAWEAGAPLVIVEGPMDALSLAVCGAPAVALVCTRAPHWLRTAAAFRRALVGLDADAEGEAKADILLRELAPFAKSVERLRPPAWPLEDGRPGKDWNDALLAPEGGYGATCAWLMAYGLSTEML